MVLSWEPTADAHINWVKRSCWRSSAGQLEKWIRHKTLLHARWRTSTTRHQRKAEHPWWKCHSRNRVHTSISVLELPPSESDKIQVSIDSRYGTIPLDLCGRKTMGVPGVSGMNTRRAFDGPAELPDAMLGLLVASAWEKIGAARFLPGG